MHCVKDFANDVVHKLGGYSLIERVRFRGSFADGTHDEYSDVDVEAYTSQPLNETFFSGLNDLLIESYGQALVRYDPDFADDVQAQNIRFSFYHLPVFWRIDLTVRSVAIAATKWPNPFPEWEI